MAHNINFNEQTGKHSFFSVQEKPWHNLGQIVTDYPNSKEALIFAGLNYEVVKRKIYTHDGDLGKGLDFLIRDIEMPNHQATIRTDTNQVLGVVGKDYEIVQNVDAFAFFDSIVGGDGIQYETAGALGNGERIFITAKLPSYIKVGKDDLIEQYLFLTTSHDGYGSITVAFTPVRIVCNNTLNAAMRNHSNSIKIRHTANAKERLTMAHTVMGISNKMSQQLEEIFNNWARIPIIDKEVKKLIQVALAPNKETLHKIGSGGENSAYFENMCNSAYEYAMSNPTQDMNTTKGTLYGAYNAVTGYFQNVRTYKDSESKLKSMMLGGLAQMRIQKAFNICNDFATKGISALN
jgi:phage/plasmid-like protein (TIGR03299 family)